MSKKDIYRNIETNVVIDSLIQEENTNRRDAERAVKETPKYKRNAAYRLLLQQVAQEESKIAAYYMKLANEHRAKSLNLITTQLKEINEEMIANNQGELMLNDIAQYLDDVNYLFVTLTQLDERSDRIKDTLTQIELLYRDLINFDCRFMAFAPLRSLQGGALKIRVSDLANLRPIELTTIVRELKKKGIYNDEKFQKNHGKTLSSAIRRQQEQADEYKF